MDINRVLEEHQRWLDTGGAASSHANLYGQDLREYNLVGVNLAGANLCGADMSCMDLAGANFTGAQMTGVKLMGANLEGAKLVNVNMNGATLNHARCIRANLSGATLCGVTAIDVNFTRVNAEFVDFRDSDFTDSSFFGANLRATDFRNTTHVRATWPKKTNLIYGERYFIMVSNGDWVRAGCQSYSAEDWRQFSEKDIHKMDIVYALKYYPRLLDIIDFYCGKGDRPDWIK